MAQLERTVKKSIMAYLNSIPNSFFEVSPPGSRSGKADITGCLAGHYIAIECKRPVLGRLRKLQRYEIDRIKKAGGIAFEARSVEEVRARLREEGL